MLRRRPRFSITAQPSSVALSLFGAQRDAIGGRDRVGIA
jgi:hypothetical protein